MNYWFLSGIITNQTYGSLEYRQQGTISIFMVEECRPVWFTLLMVCFDEIFYVVFLPQLEFFISNFVLY